MATTDIYQIVGGLQGRRSVAFLGGAVDDAVQIDAFAAARVAANDTAGTFTAWVNVPDITGTYAVVSCGDASVVEYISLTIAAGKIEATCNDNTTLQWEVNTTNVVLTPHKWHHIAITQNATTGISGTPKIYVDGVEIPYSDLTITDATDNGTWFDDCAGIDGGSIGAAEEGGDAGLTEEFKGGISDIKYWSVELTAAQIDNDYKGIINTTNLISHWDFNGDYIDSVSAHNGTAAGDIILTSDYSEFTSKLRNTLAAAPVVADKVVFSVENNTGYAIIIKAA